MSCPINLCNNAFFLIFNIFNLVQPANLRQFRLNPFDDAVDPGIYLLGKVRAQLPEGQQGIAALAAVGKQPLRSPERYRRPKGAAPRPPRRKGPWRASAPPLSWRQCAATATFVHAFEFGYLPFGKFHDIKFVKIGKRDNSDRSKARLFDQRHGKIPNFNLQGV